MTELEHVMVKFKKLHPSARVPTMATDGSGAYDLYAATVDGKETIGSHVEPGYPQIVGTGLAVEIPKGWRLMVLSRSGHGLNHNVRLSNSVGLIDSDYRGEIMMRLDATEDADADALGMPPLFVRPGDRVAQCYLERVTPILWLESEALGDTSRRGKLAEASAARTSLGFTPKFEGGGNYGVVAIDSAVRVKCDGNHGGAPCGDPECWQLP